MSKKKTAPSQDPVLFRFFNEIGIIEQLSRNAFERVMPGGMKLSQFTVLNHFVRLGGVRSPAELASAFQVTRGAMTNTLQKLEAKGYIEITPDPRDGRGKRVTITEAGARARADAVSALAPHLDRLSDLIDLKEIEGVLPALVSLREILDEDRNPQPEIAAK